MVIVAIFYMALGILIKHGKMYFLIAGYNTMAQEEQDKYDIARLATLFRNVMFGMAAIIILGYIAERWFEIPNGEWFAFIASSVIGIPYLLINSNSDKFKVSRKE